MATRISLIRSIRQREERQQIGTMVRPFVKGLIDIEKRCLIRLSQAARTSGQLQIALNSVMKAQQLGAEHTSDISEEFANVLWVQKEEKLAVQFLRNLLANSDHSNNDVEDPARRAIWLSRLGTWISEACLEKPAEIWTRYFDPSISLLERAKEGKGHYDASHAKIYRQCAMFSERQYYAMLKSPDAIRFTVYVDRKKKEIEYFQEALAKTHKESKEYSLLNSEKSRALTVFNEDSKRFVQHNMLRDTSLRQAIDMHSRCLETSEDFNDDSAIRLCSLWLANFDDESILDCIRAALDRIPSRKFAFLAVSSLTLDIITFIDRYRHISINLQHVFQQYNLIIPTCHRRIYRDSSCACARSTHFTFCIKSTA